MTPEKRWKDYCDNQGCWYEDMPAVKEAFLDALKTISIISGGELYEKLYDENKSLQESAYKRKHYTSKWKERFGYDDGVSFDIVLEDLLKMKDSIPKSCETCSAYLEDSCRNYHGSLSCKGHNFKYWKSSN